MLEKHAEKHLDRINFPTNHGKEYIIERGKYTKMAYGRLQQNWQNAEDAVQESYCIIMEYPPRIQMSEDSFEAFFTTVLNGVIGRMFRNERAQERNCVTPAGKFLQYSEVEEGDTEDKREEVIALADEEKNPETAYVAGELLDKIIKEIDKLKPNPRTNVALSVLYGYRPYEIVALTGQSRDNVYSDIKRFRNYMEEKL